MAMDRPDRVFVLGVIATSLAVPTSLWALSPFAEPRAALGVVAGWGLALLAIVPSFFLMSRVMGTDDSLRFQQAFMGGTMGRFVLSILGVVAFGLAVEQPPMWTFVLTFFLGYALLSALEVALLLKKTPDRTHA